MNTIFKTTISLLLFSLISCEKTELTANNQTISIKNGTVIGNINLSAYRHEVALSETSLNYQIQDREDKVLKECSTSESASDWNQISAKIDFEKFKSLPAFNGTSGPALGDVGYEYIEIKQDSDSYRILFPTGSDVKEITDLLKMVRAKRAFFEQSCK
ncbi:hypothetical protein EMA8858_00049 [Emticicia aquatica]|uniref:Lipoprotein n=1 Tax=Emticicia aquatica TaxID=1681835 RepID=A0ABN8EM57_9BACT|nr:hypothetical protein [Emticicia aquatica]CAH0993944.1 hypothetical protein EMA8858_00049 [Emticicia aquatica]